MTDKLDANLKKCTAFVKKLREVSEKQRDAILKEISVLKLTKYLEEGASLGDVYCILMVIFPQLLVIWQRIAFATQQTSTLRFKYALSFRFTLPLLPTRCHADLLDAAHDVL